MTMLKRHRVIEKSKTPIEEIIEKTDIDPSMMQRKVWLEGSVLAIPLIVSFGFYLSMIMGSVQPTAGTMLSPTGNVQSLIFFTFAFIIVYSLFLVFQYQELAKKLDFLKARKKRPTRKRQRKK